MSPTATDDALGYCARIRDLILHHGGGWADGEALQKFRLLSYAASRAADDAECSQLMRTADQYAADLYSRSDHYKWARGNTAGSDVLRLCVLSKLDAFRERLLRLRNRVLPLDRITAVDRDGGAGDEV